MRYTDMIYLTTGQFLAILLLQVQKKWIIRNNLCPSPGIGFLSSPTAA